RREQAQRIPPIAPCVADSLVRVENDEAQAGPGEVIADGQACLTTTDHDHVVRLTPSGCISRFPASELHCRSPLLDKLCCVSARHVSLPYQCVNDGGEGYAELRQRASGKLPITAAGRHGYSSRGLRSAGAGTRTLWQLRVR